LTLSSEHAQAIFMAQKNSPKIDRFARDMAKISQEFINVR
jgi:hypothetical protein